MREARLTFGPVPSRRLGRSVGINHIPPKICSYACAYCQTGGTYRKQIRRRAFSRPQQVFQQVKTHLNDTLVSGESIDYLTFVPDGEPTLDNQLGTCINLLRPIGVDIAVITNASLIFDDDVKNEYLRYPSGHAHTAS